MEKKVRKFAPSTAPMWPCGADAAAQHAGTKARMPKTVAALLVDSASPNGDQGPGSVSGKSALQDMRAEHAAANLSENLAFDAQMLQVQSMINLGIGSAMIAAGITELRINNKTLIDLSARFDVLTLPEADGDGYTIKLVERDAAMSAAMKAAMGGIDE